MSTKQEQQLVFGPFRVDPVTNQLWRGEQTVSLQPKPLAVLLYLARRPGQIVTKQELLKAVWAGTVVTKAVVKECVRAIRNALGEEGTTSQYLETVGREGYRFRKQEPGPTFKVQGAMSALASGPQPPAPIFVGRETDLAQLHQWLDKALRGEPQLVFVTGEPGIGKTTVVDLFREQVRATGNVTIGHGQCVEQYGEGEAYLPVLEAMSRLCREEGGQQIIPLLRKYAPMWLVQLSGVADEEELQALRLQVQGATQQRMLREMAEAIEVGTARRPLVLIIEDLQWSDHATVELLAYLARRGQRARLLVVATYRPTDVVLRAHPLKDMKQELQAHGQCEELRLELLTVANVTEYVEGRFTETLGTQALGQLIHRRTEGNALFMVNVVEDLLRQGIIAEKDGRWELRGAGAQLDVPDTLRQLIEKQIARLSEEEQRVLEGASVAGMEFRVAAVAAAMKRESDAIEESCEEIAWQGHFLTETGIAEWPDGTVSGRYAFRHALYQNVLYERIAEARRVRLHRLIGERAERGYGECVGEIAAELAIHFERGHDYHRAVRYRQQAGETAMQRNAYQEAIIHFTTGLESLKTLSDTPEHAKQELTFQITLGSALVVTRGYAAPEVEQAYTRARALCQQLEETPQLFPVLWGLWDFYLVRAEHKTARELGEQLLTLAQRVEDPVLLLEAHDALGQTLCCLGEFAPARAHVEQGIALYDPQQHHSLAFLYGGEDPGVLCLCYAGRVLWALGYADQALQRNHEALSLARGLSHPHSLAVALINAAWLHQYRREGQAAQERAEAAIRLSTEQGFPHWVADGASLRGWVLAEQGQAEEGIAQVRWGIAAWQDTGAEAGRPYYLALLAEAYGKTGQVEEGLTALVEALAAVNKTGERRWEAELYRLKGTLTLESKASLGQVTGKSKTRQDAKGKTQKPVLSVVEGAKITSPQPLAPNTQGEVEQEAEGYFLKAIEIARKQQAKSLELRASMSLTRLWQRQGKKKQAHTMLSEVYTWFTEGFDTKDLQEAKALLEELSH